MSDVSCLNGPAGLDWLRVQGMVRRLLLEGENTLHHPVFDYLWLPEFAACDLGATTLRLLHVLSMSSGHLFLEYYSLEFEARTLIQHSWSAVARSGWGAALFAILHTLSTGVCQPADVRRGGRGISVAPGLLVEDWCESPTYMSSTNLTDGTQSASFAKALLASSRALRSPNGFDAAVDNAQRWVLRAAATSEGSIGKQNLNKQAGSSSQPPRLIDFLRTHRPIFQSLYQVAERWERKSGFASRSLRVSTSSWRRSSWGGTPELCRLFQEHRQHVRGGDSDADIFATSPAQGGDNGGEVDGQADVIANHGDGFLAGVSGAALSCAPPSAVAPPLVARTLRLCSISRSRVEPTLEAVVLGAAFRGTGLKVSRNTERHVELDVALFFDQLDRNHGCDTWLGAHLLRLECELRVVGSLGTRTSVTEKTFARVLSGLAWLRPIKGNLVTCQVPAHMLGQGELRVTLVELDKGWRVPLKLCRDSEADASHQPWPRENVTICTEPFHSIRNETEHLFRHVLAYHVRQGAFIDVYDLDGSAKNVVEPFVLAGRARYFPHFPRQVSEHVGEIAWDERKEPAAGCSAGVQEIHCIMGNRGRSRWVVPRLDPDEYFARATVVGDAHCRGAFRDFELGGRFSGAARHKLAAVFVGSVEFGGRPRRPPTTPAFARFVRRSKRTTPRWMPIVNPDNSLSTHIHSVRPRPGSSVADFKGVALHHYLDAFGYLKRVFIHPSRTEFERTDERVARVCERWGR